MTGKEFKDIRRLHISSKIEKIYFGKVVFPDLEEVIVDPANQHFIVRDGMLLNDNGKTLVRCMVCKGDSLVLSEKITCISSRAFYGTEFSKIIFPKSNFTVENNAFECSKWEALQHGTIIVGDLFFKADTSNGTLVVPARVHKLHQSIIKSQELLHTVVCNTISQADGMIDLLFNRKPRCLKILSPFSSLDEVILGQFDFLEELVITKNHEEYKTMDGVLYSKDGKKLVFYPMGKKNSEFCIPDGVERIVFETFAGNNYLKSVVMPDSVKLICADAFYKCIKLESVRLSANLEEIADSYTQDGGVFRKCTSLKSIVLPDKLKYLGKLAFYNTALSSIVLNDQLEQIGDYALLTDNLTKISIPSSVKRLGVCALGNIKEVEVYEGTAKGFIFALNDAVFSQMSKDVHTSFHNCQATVLHKNSGRKDVLFIPGRLNMNVLYQLDVIWNQEFFNSFEYENCLLKVVYFEELVQLILLRLPYHNLNDNSKLVHTVRTRSFQIAEYLLLDGKESDFLSFLQYNFLSRDSLQKLLKASIEKGLSVRSAYLMEQISKLTSSSNKFEL